ncbi:MAG: heat-inducible transcriptional repressor HrcA [Halanaerobiales bacterium]|nr:heat-inducible transcriptional repressor HrcA [Halanaerobiales bacterium]
MMVKNLDERKNSILHAIIQEHIITASPIGSRTIAKKYDLGVSSATIRNEMADLEELGYLEQPHTSAGRIPSDKGYRYYVDILMKNKGINSDKLIKTLSEITKNRHGINGIVSSMTTMLSEFTKYATMITEPEFKDLKISELQLMKVTEDKLLLVMVTDNGFVSDKLINIKEDLDKRKIRYINNFLINKIRDKEINELTDQYFKEIENELVKKINLSHQLFTIINKEIDELIKPEDVRIYIGGTSYILDQPEFNDIEYLKKVLNILDHEDNLKKLIKAKNNKELEVRIGHENEIEEMQRCSVVIANYSIGDKAVGKIGVLGPTRMEYPRVISTVNIVSDILSKIISEVNK